MIHKTASSVLGTRKASISFFEAHPHLINTADCRPDLMTHICFCFQTICVRFHHFGSKQGLTISCNQFFPHFLNSSSLECGLHLAYLFCEKMKDRKTDNNFYYIYILMYIIYLKYIYYIYIYICNTNNYLYFFYLCYLHYTTYTYIYIYYIHIYYQFR